MPAALALLGLGATIEAASAAETWASQPAVAAVPPPSETAQPATAQPATAQPATDPSVTTPAGRTPVSDPSVVGPDVPDHWLDRTHYGIHDLIVRGARNIDRMSGEAADQTAYDHASGSVSTALLWSQFDGFQPRVRFRVDVPFPGMGERFNAFIGRVNVDEYVTERQRNSGAIPQQTGPLQDDQTLAGINYQGPGRFGDFDAGAGVRVALPLDPYVKVGYTFERGLLDRLRFTYRQTAFWENTEDFGVTTRVSFDRILFSRWLTSWTTAGTYSQKSEGVRGYSALTFLRPIAQRRAFAFELGLDGESRAPVPLTDYGVKAAYRQSVLRDWFVLEVRTSLTWPKDTAGVARSSSWGVGLAFEMFFGDAEFLARPVTF